MAASDKPRPATRIVSFLSSNLYECPSLVIQVLTEWVDTPCNIAEQAQLYRVCALHNAPNMTVNVGDLISGIRCGVLRP